MSLLSGGLSALLALLLVSALWDTPVHEGVSASVAGAMGHTGVAHPVTAVLLDFRAYDTLLEMAVVLLAVLATWSLGRCDTLPARPVQGPVMRGGLRHLIPLAVLTGGYLIWAGGAGSGGAFQGGAVLAASGVMWVLAWPRRPDLPAPLGLRVGVTLGVAVFLAIGVAGLPLGPGFMGYPPGWSYGLILTVETAAACSIALSLVLLFLGGRPWRDAEDG
nr:MnhB domain-containing protein [Ectothiorhodospira mobilis]